MRRTSGPWLRLRVLPALCGCLAASVASPAGGQAGEPYSVRSSATPCLIVRAAPASAGERLACVPPGTRVEVFQSVPYWRRVRAGDATSGWVAKKFLEPVAAPEPVVGPLGELPDSAWLEIHLVDVGQGDGIWIHTHDDGIDGNGVFEGRNIVIDGGPDASDARNEMLRYLRRHAHRGAVVDDLILSHPHDDHYPGAEGVLRHFEIRRFYDPGFAKKGAAYGAFRRAVLAERVEGRPVEAMFGLASFAPLQWGREVAAEVLYSYPGVNPGLGSGNTLENNASIVLRVQYGSHSFLFMGDAEGKDRGDPPDRARYVEKVLLETVPPGKLRSTVLKLAHHGSETSSTLPFIAAVDPEHILVSSGRRRYGPRFLPDQSVLRRYCDFNPSIRIHRTDRDDAAEGHTARTDQDGDHVVLRTNGRVLEVVGHSANQPVEPQRCSP